MAASGDRLEMITWFPAASSPAGIEKTGCFAQLQGGGNTRGWSARFGTDCDFPFCLLVLSIGTDTLLGRSALFMLPWVIWIVCVMAWPEASRLAAKAQAISVARGLILTF